MPGIDYSSHINSTLPRTAGVSTSAPKTDAAGVSFGDLLDVINPLQHLPVISTLYREISGDKIGTPEKIAGDTLYGGLYGFFASLADTAFQAITGKNVGDTVLAFLTGDDSSAATAVAAAPASVKPASAVSLPTPDLAALMKSLSAKGVDPATASRAAYAYSRATGLSTVEASQ
jgi:hypothetical protein